MRWFTFFCILLSICLFQSTLIYWINMGSVVPDLYFPLVVFYSLLTDMKKKYPCKLVYRFIQRFVLGRKLGDKLRFFCCRRLSHLVLQGDTVQRTFAHTGHRHLYFFRHVSCALRNSRFHLLSFNESFNRLVDDLFLLVLYRSACPALVLDIQ